MAQVVEQLPCLASTRLWVQTLVTPKETNVLKCVPKGFKPSVQKKKKIS
jgi:hypothetical protein